MNLQDDPSDYIRALIEKIAVLQTENRKLVEWLQEANKQAEKFEREFYLRGE